MIPQPTASRPSARPGASLAIVIARAAGLLLVIAAVGAGLLRSPEAEPEPIVAAAAVEAEPEIPAALEPLPAEALPDPEPAGPEPDPGPEPEPDPSPPDPPGPDPAVLAAAEAELESVRDALRSAEEEESRLIAALDDAEFRGLAAGREAAESVHQARYEADRVAEARANVAALRDERDRLARSIAAIAAIPPPREALNRSQAPVARTITGEEYHFEVRGDRVAFIDLDRLLEKAQADARLRLRMAGSTSRSLSGTVGPIGAFSLSYEVGATAIGLVSDRIGGPGVSTSYGLQGFEIVPARHQRGEPFDLIFSPVSEFGRVIHRLNPHRTTITLWVYPDGFAMYRRLWDALHRSGFTVAARPLPEGMPIRGGPNGSRSSGQ